jgi:hypothetical protein
MGKRKLSFANRIVGHGEKPAGEFKFNPLNWRRHPESQEAALREILSSVGWITGVIVSKRTGLLIDGHARVDAALKIEPNALVPFIEVDVTPEEEQKMLLLFDPIGGMATADDDAIKQLLEMVGLEHDSLLESIAGFTNIELDTADDGPNLNDPAFNYQSQYGVIVTCRDEPHQQTVYNELLEAGYEVKVVVV